MKKFKVWIKSKPGFYAQYDGSLEVYGKDEHDAAERALAKLRRGSFPDRSRDMWLIEKVERVLT